MAMFAEHVLDRLLQCYRGLPSSRSGEKRIISALERDVVRARCIGDDPGPDARRVEQQVENRRAFHRSAGTQVEHRLGGVPFEDVDVRTSDVPDVAEVAKRIEWSAMKDTIAPRALELEELAHPVGERRLPVPSRTDRVEWPTYGDAESRCT